MAPHGRVEDKSQMGGIDLYVLDVAAVTIHGGLPSNDTVGFAVDRSNRLLDRPFLTFSNLLLDPVEIQSTSRKQLARRRVFRSAHNRRPQRDYAFHDVG